MSHLRRSVERNAVGLVAAAMLLAFVVLVVAALTAGGDDSSNEPASATAVPSGARVAGPTVDRRLVGAQDVWTRNDRQRQRELSRRRLLLSLPRKLGGLTLTVGGLRGTRPVIVVALNGTPAARAAEVMRAARYAYADATPYIVEYRP